MIPYSGCVALMYPSACAQGLRPLDVIGSYPWHTLQRVNLSHMRDAGVAQAIARGLRGAVRWNKKEDWILGAVERNKSELPLGSALQMLNVWFAFSAQ